MNKKAFTLVELIVVITILAVLGTIAFISFQNYVLSSRDSKRTTDIKNIVKSLELSKLQTGVYPQPGGVTNITFSGATAWKQGEFNNDVTRVVRNFKEAPKDPLVDSFYAYSVTNNQGEYQLGAVLEDTDYGTSAKGKLAAAYVKGNYNGKTVKVSTGGTTYILGAPSILTSDLNETDLLDIITAKKLVYKGHQNLPASYTGTVYDLDGGFNFSPASIVAYQGDLASIDNATLVDNLQTIYTGSVIAEEPDIEVIFSEDKDLTANVILGKKPFSKPSSGSSSSSSSSSSSGGPVDDGNYWIQTSGGDLKKLVTTLNGDMFITGKQESNNLFGNSLSSPSGNFYIAKLNADFSLEWINYYDCFWGKQDADRYSCDFSSLDLHLDTNNNLYLGLNYKGEFDTYVGEQKTGGHFEIGGQTLSNGRYIVKYNSSGVYQWHYSKAGSDNFHFNINQNNQILFVDKNQYTIINDSSSIIFTKPLTSTVVFDAILNSNLYLFYANGNNIVFDKINPINGNIITNKTFLTSYNFPSWYHDYAKIYITGSDVYLSFLYGEIINGLGITEDNSQGWSGPSQVITKFSSTLTPIWSSLVGSGDSIIDQLHKSNGILKFNDNILNVGWTEDACDGYRKLRISNMNDSDGNINYNNLENSGGDNSCAKSINQINSGIIVSGTYQDTMDILGVSVTYDGTTNTRSFIAKINPTTGEAK